MYGTEYGTYRQTVQANVIEVNQSEAIWYRRHAVNSPANIPRMSGGSRFGPFLLAVAFCYIIIFVILL